MPDNGPLVAEKKVILVKLESTRGTAVVPDLPVEVPADTRLEDTTEYIGRAAINGHGGHTVGVRGSSTGRISLKVEFRGNGNAGSPDLEAGLAALVQMAGYKLDTGVYKKQAVPGSGKTGTVYLYQDGVLLGLSGAAAELSIDGQSGQPVYFTFELSGLWRAVIDAALPTITLPTVLPPLFDGSVFGITPGAGASFAPRISKFGVKHNNVVQPRSGAASVGLAYYCIPARKPQITMDPEQELVANQDFYGHFHAGTNIAFSALLGLAAGNKATIAAAKCEYASVKQAAQGELAANDVTLQVLDNAGDDLTITPA